VSINAGPDLDKLEKMIRRVSAASKLRKQVNEKKKV